MGGRHGAAINLLWSGVLVVTAYCFRLLLRRQLRRRQIAARPTFCRQIWPQVCAPSSRHSCRRFNRLCAGVLGCSSSGEVERVMSSSESDINGSEKQPFSEEQRNKINEVRSSLGALPGKLYRYSSDAAIARYLIARNWNVPKATKMLKETLKWRLEYKPEEIRWDEIAHEGETGKVYRANYSDKFGRSILVLRPGCENSKSVKGKIRYLVYSMENAILNLQPDQEQMVWLIDFQGYNLSNISIRTTKETADVLQNHYPERLGLAILYNPPKFFEPFWNVAKHLLEPKTYRKVKFVYSDDDSSKKIMEELFNMDELDCAFGGNNQVGFNIEDYAARMREDDKRMPFFWSEENDSSPPDQCGTATDNLSTRNCESDSPGTEKQ